MAAGREGPLENALDAINNDPTSLTPKPRPTPVSASDDTDSSESPAPPQFGTLAWGVDVIEDRWPFLVAGFAILVIAVIAWAVKNL